MKATATLVLVLLSLVSTFVSTTNAQTTAKGVGCMGPHPGAPNHWSATCNGTAECDAVLAAHNRQWHSGGGGGGTVVYDRPRTPAGAIIFGGFAGGAAGALGGSFYHSLDGTNQAANAALGGGGAMVVLATAVNANKINPVAGAIVSAGAGAATGTAWARYQEEQGNLPNKKAIIAASAGAGIVTFALGKVAGGSNPKLAPRFLGPKGQMDILATHRYLGALFRW